MGRTERALESRREGRDGRAHDRGPVSAYPEKTLEDTTWTSMSIGTPFRDTGSRGDVQDVVRTAIGGMKSPPR